MGCSRQLSVDSRLTACPYFGFRTLASLLAHLCRNLVNRLRLFPVKGVNILGPGVTKHNRRIVGGDRKPLSEKARGGKILEVHNPLRLVVAQPNPDNGARSAGIACLKVLAVF